MKYSDLNESQSHTYLLTVHIHKYSIRKYTFSTPEKQQLTFFAIKCDIKLCCIFLTNFNNNQHQLIMPPISKDCSNTFLERSFIYALHVNGTN